MAPEPTPTIPAAALEFGVDTFGDLTTGANGKPVSYAQTLRDVVDEGITADQAGLDFFAVGEHHRDDYAISAPEVVLAAIAQATSRIRLGSAVTVLSSDDPVRVFERFSTVDALSRGRTEIIMGRGSFTESFPLFGYDLSDYEALFEEKLAMFAKLLEHNATGQAVNWQGTFTQNLSAAHLYPPTESKTLKTWVAVGGSPQSVVRAAQYDFPLFLAIIGGSADRFAPFAHLYRRALQELGKTQNNPVAFHSPGYIAETDEQAIEDFYEPYLERNERIGSERGWSRTTRAAYLYEVENGALLVGSPETVARKLYKAMRVLGATRADIRMATGALPHSKLSNSIGLFGSQVVPLVRDMATAHE